MKFYISCSKSFYYNKCYYLQGKLPNWRSVRKNLRDPRILMIFASHLFPLKTYATLGYLWSSHRINSHFPAQDPIAFSTLTEPSEGVMKQWTECLILRAIIVRNLWKSIIWFHMQCCSCTWNLGQILKIKFLFCFL